MMVEKEAREIGGGRGTRPTVAGLEDERRGGSQGCGGLEELGGALGLQPAKKRWSWPHNLEEMPPWREPGHTFPRHLRKGLPCRHLDFGSVRPAGLLDVWPMGTVECQICVVLSFCVCVDLLWQQEEINTPGGLESWKGLFGVKGPSATVAEVS